MHVQKVIPTGVLVVALAIITLPCFVSMTQAEDAAYIGTETCLGCHDGMEADFAS